MEQPAAVVDHDFVLAVVRCGRGDSTSLVEYLLSDRPIEIGERLMLSELVAGDWRKPREPRGRPPLERGEIERRNDATAMYKRMMDWRRADPSVPFGREETVTWVAEHFGFTRTAFLGLIDDRKERKPQKVSRKK